MDKSSKNGTCQTINGVQQVYYDNYWIRYYQPPPESLAAKKRLIDALTKRTFHHTEAGINTPGERLEQARAAYEAEADPGRKRVNAAMLAGALFNRATDIFTTIVELEERGIRITHDNQLMQECSQCFTEALALSPNVKHHSGEQGIDELWGEPVKAFSMSIADYYCSRYRKIAQAMRDIDLVGHTIHDCITALPWFEAAAPLVDDFIEIAKRECEIIKTDPAYLKVWPEFVADGEKLLDFLAYIPPDATTNLERYIKRGTGLLKDGKNLISWIANVRVPMPLSMRNYLRRCTAYQRAANQYRR